MVWQGTRPSKTKQRKRDRGRTETQIQLVPPFPCPLLPPTQQRKGRTPRGKLKLRSTRGKKKGRKKALPPKKARATQADAKRKNTPDCKLVVQSLPSPSPEKEAEAKAFVRQRLQMLARHCPHPLYPLYPLYPPQWCPRMLAKVGNHPGIWPSAGLGRQLRIMVVQKCGSPRPCCAPSLCPPAGSGKESGIGPGNWAQPPFSV